MSFCSPPERHLTDQTLLKFSLIVCFSLELFLAAGRRIRRDRDKEVQTGGISLSLIAEFPPVTARVAERELGYCLIVTLKPAEAGSLLKLRSL